MRVPPGPARSALLAAIGLLACASAAAAQRTRSITSIAGNSDQLVVVLEDTRGAGPRTGRRTPPARTLTGRQKAEIVNRAFPEGLPSLPKPKLSEDPTGLSEQVVLGPERLVDADQTASLILTNATIRPTMKEFEGFIEVPAGGWFVVSYRPSKVGAPIMIECQLQGPGKPPSSRLSIKTNKQGAAVGTNAYIMHEEPLVVVVVPTEVGVSPLQVKVETESVRVHACAVTPLS